MNDFPRDNAPNPFCSHILSAPPQKNEFRSDGPVHNIFIYMGSYFEKQLIKCKHPVSKNLGISTVLL